MLEELEADVIIEAHNRDEEVAQSFGRMAELGYMDTEFTVYGCAYWQDNERYYYISADETKVYDFREKAYRQNIYPTVTMKYSLMAPVPSGQEEAIRQTVKKELAYRLQATYSAEFLESLFRLGQTPAKDSALPLLEQEQESLQFCYDRERLRLFDLTINAAHASKLLSEKSMAQLQAWLEDRGQQMEDDAMSKDLFEKRFFAIAYYKPDKAAKYYLNACKERAGARREALLNDGFIVTPLFFSDCPFNYTYDVNQARNKFRNQLGAFFDKHYLQVWEQITQLPGAIPQIPFIWQNRYQQETLNFYSHLWHIK